MDEVIPALEVEGTAEALDDGMGRAGDKAADGLDAVGWDSGAEGVRDAGAQLDDAQLIEVLTEHVVGCRLCVRDQVCGAWGRRSSPCTTITSRRGRRGGELCRTTRPGQAADCHGSSTTLGPRHSVSGARRGKHRTTSRRVFAPLRLLSFAASAGLRRATSAMSSSLSAGRTRSSNKSQKASRGRWASAAACWRSRSSPTSMERARDSIRPSV